MALQTDNLVMFGLGIQGDTPANSQQPALVNGVHLRWFFNPELGFPLYGFHIFRRPALTPTLQLISTTTQMRALTAGATPASPLALGLGSLSASGGSLATVDQFAPTGTVELKLDTAQSYEFALSEPASVVEVKIGIITGLTSMRVQALADGVVMAENTASGVAASIATVTLKADRITAIRIAPIAGAENKAVLVDIGCGFISANAKTGWRPIRGLNYPLSLPAFHPSYPCSRGASPNYASARALEAQRITYGSAPGNPTVVYQTGTVTTTAGSPIVAGSGTAWTSASLVGKTLRVTGDPDAYTINAVMAAGRLVLSRPISGSSLSAAAYQILDDPFGELYNDVMQLVSQGATGSPMYTRSLPDPITTAGTIRVTEGSTTVTGTGTAWTSAMVGLSLQVAVPTSGTITTTKGSATIVGTATNWDSSLVGRLLQVGNESSLFMVVAVETPTLLTLERAYLGTTGGGKAYKAFHERPYTIAGVTSATQLTLSEAYGDPTGSAKAFRIFTRLGASNGDGTGIERHYPLELLLLGALEPATAQTLGLYWVDTSAEIGVAYDYLIMADYTNAAKLDVWNAWELAKAGRFTNGVEAYIVWGKKREAQATLAAPGELKLYSLPGVQSTTAIPGRANFNGNSVGLRWNLGVTAEGALLPDRPIYYHVWRASLGVPAPTAQPAASSYSLITANAPIVTGDPELESGAQPNRPPDWPPFALHAFDNGMADGWYSYKVSAVDMFGRHSTLSAAGEWVLWNPRPTPLPWYAATATGDTVHSYAIELLDLLPPPVPTAVEAYTLDHDDPTLVQDAAYTTWRAQAGMASTIGIRVRWRWSPEHMAQAPDTKEFRIYFHPGSTLPANPASVAGWNARLAVIAASDTTAYTTDPATGVRTYDVLLPRTSGDTFFDTPPLATSAATPLVYASVAVSAADDKTHRMAVDPRGTTGRLANRQGNEGRLGQPPKIFRVHRVPPAKPELPPPPAGNVYASPADYLNQSFYTYRWGKPADMRERFHIFRAMDDTLFKVDWEARPKAAHSASDMALFPPQWQDAGNATRRQNIVNALNQLNTYKSTYNATADAAAKQTARNNAFAYYRALSNDALLVLAGLKSNESAFTQLTVEPLNPAQHADKKGPDSSTSYVPQATLCAYVDALDGRSSNRYFYRSATVNTVHNRSADLSLSTPPIWLPDVQPPRAPSIVKLIGGDRKIDIVWASNREVDLSAYRVYRATDEAATRDLRLMTLVQTVTVPAGAPSARPAQVTWSDTTAPALTNVYYQVVAVDTAGNASAPSATVMGRAYDESLPAPPPLTVAWTTTPSLARATWTATDETLLQRRSGPAEAWESVGSWRGPGSQSVDDSVSDGYSWQYRLRVRKATGALGVGTTVTLSKRI